MPARRGGGALLALCSGLTVAALLATLPLPVAELQSSRAIRIKPDGSVEPPGAPIAREGDVYTLLSDLDAAQDCVIVEKSGVVLNGNGRLVKGSGAGTGVHLRGVTDVVVRDLRVEGFRYGLSVNGSARVSLVNVSVASSRVGVGITNSSGILVEASAFQSCMVGVFIEGSSRCRLLNNAFNGCGLYVRGSYGNEVEGNVVNGRPLVYLEGVQGGSVKGVVGQVVLVRCRNVTVSVEVSAATVGVLLSECEHSRVVGSNVSGCVIGVDLWRSSGCAVEAGSFRGNEIGLRLAESRGNLVVNSSFVGNARGVYVEGGGGNVLRSCLVGSSTAAGVHLVNSSDNRVEACILWRNERGLYAASSAANEFLYNDFVENGANAILEHCGPNAWDDGARGNFWDDYAAKHGGAGRRGDTWSEPYTLGEGNVDRHPSASPYRVVRVDARSPYGEVKGSGWYPKGSAVSIAVQPTRYAVMVFDHWKRNGAILSRDPCLVLTVEEHVELEAVWRVDFALAAAIAVALILALTLPIAGKVRRRAS